MIQGERERERLREGRRRERERKQRGIERGKDGENRKRERGSQIDKLTSREYDRKRHR